LARTGVPQPGNTGRIKRNGNRPEWLGRNSNLNALSSPCSEHSPCSDLFPPPWMRVCRKSVSCRAKHHALPQQCRALEPHLDRLVEAARHDEIGVGGVEPEFGESHETCGKDACAVVLDRVDGVAVPVREMNDSASLARIP
jgi:hypothetical protein